MTRVVKPMAYIGLKREFTVSERKTISIILEGEYEGEPISPEVVDIAYLRELLDDVEKLVSTETKRQRGKIALQIEKGSLLLRVEADSYHIDSLKADLESVGKTSSFAGLHPKRSKVLEKWHSNTKSHPIHYKFNLLDDNWDFELKGETEIRPQGEIWLDTELYLFGEITNIGGITNSNFHLNTKEYGNVTVSIPKETVREDSEARTYKHYLVRIKCKQNLASGDIQEAKFVEWVDYYPDYDEEKLDQAIDLGKESWKGVSDSVDFIRKLRGYND